MPWLSKIPKINGSTVANSRSSIPWTTQLKTATIEVVVDKRVSKFIRDVTNLISWYQSIL